MKETLSREQVVRWLRAAAESMGEQKELLTRLDKAIGDGDHGINMDRGFRKVLEQLDGAAASDLSGILKTAAMALISSVGGASGPLYGTFFLRASAAAAGKKDLSASDFHKLMEAGLGGVRQRGKAQAGDKTMVDALLPAVQAFGEALSEQQNLTSALARGVEAARRGAEATVPLIARKGRASYLGERSAGHQDPGATSSYLILKALHDVIA
ncbi:MAG: dihydroxyacetone kinase subunit L [Spirochaetaceae bacterium]|nr:MAG: dihydroxyacetone kinase subunit L [Spirochaetaceae bacterium]